MNELDKEIHELTCLMVSIRDSVVKNQGYCSLRDLAEFIIRNGYVKFDKSGKHLC
jgi:hypothetical protein